MTHRTLRGHPGPGAAGTHSPPRPTFSEVERITTLWFSVLMTLTQTRRQKPQNAALAACDGLAGPNHASRGQPFRQRLEFQRAENAALPDTTAPP